MNIAVLRAEASDAALESLRLALDLEIDADWETGDPRRRGGVQEQSGFTAFVANVSDPTALIAEVRKFLERCRTRNAVLSSHDLTTQLDIGISVGQSEQFTASVVFSAEDLRIFSELGLELSVSAYPGSDDKTKTPRSEHIESDAPKRTPGAWRSATR